MLREAARTLSTGADAMVRPAAAGATVGVVALHPWGPLGGSMHDPNVRAVTSFFGAAGCATARVQFRSGFGRGEASVDDAVAAAAALLEGRGVERVAIVGYSYGSCVAIRAAARLAPATLVGWAALNPPLDYAWFLYFFSGAHADVARDLACHKLALHGTKDVFCANASFDAFVETLSPPFTAIRLEDRQHFDIASAIPTALAKWLEDDHKCDAAAFARGGGAPVPPVP